MKIRLRTLAVLVLFLICLPATGAPFFPCVHTGVFDAINPLIHPAMVFGKVDSRSELFDVMKNTKHFTVAEAKQLKKMVGAIFCPAGNGFGPSVATAFVMGKSNEIFTAGHLMTNDEGLRRDPGTCQFTNFADPRESIMIDGTAKRNKIPDWGPSVGDSRYDRVRLVLKTPVKGAKPLEPDVSEKKLVVGDQVFTASATNRGFKSSYKDPIIAACTVGYMDEPGDGMARARTNCDMSKGGSGAPLLYRRDGKLIVKGLVISVNNNELPDHTEFNKDTNFQNNLLFDGEFLEWVAKGKD